jgi:heme A synthase
MLIGITGAVAALADTLFPATSLRSSLTQDVTPGAPALLHFRLLHPLVAVVAAGYIFWVVARAARRRGPLSKLTLALVILLSAQLGIGIVNVLLLTPVWLQIVHLLVGDVFWIVLVLASANLLLANVGKEHTEVTVASGFTSHAR